MRVLPSFSRETRLLFFFVSHYQRINFNKTTGFPPKIPSDSATSGGADVMSLAKSPVLLLRLDLFLWPGFTNVERKGWIPFGYG